VNPFNGIERYAQQVLDVPDTVLENPFNGIESRDTEHGGEEPTAMPNPFNGIERGSLSISS